MPKVEPLNILLGKKKLCNSLRFRDFPSGTGFMMLHFKVKYNHSYTQQLYIVRCTLKHVHYLMYNNSRLSSLITCSPCAVHCTALTVRLVTDRTAAHPGDQHLHVHLLRLLHRLRFLLYPQPLHRCHHRQLQRTEEEDKYLLVVKLMFKIASAQMAVSCLRSQLYNLHFQLQWQIF